ISGRAAQRQALIKEFDQRLRSGEVFDFLYSEAHTLPMPLTEPHHLPTRPLTDLRLFALAKKHGIPIGLYYRDLYWAFPGHRRFGPVKTIYAKLFHQWELLFFNRYLDAFFFPHPDRELIYGKLRLLRKDIPFFPLYAGAEVRSAPAAVKQDYFVYVGNCDPGLYDLSVLLQAFARHPELRLKICTPRGVWDQNSGYYGAWLRPNIEILHLVNEPAQQLLSQARYAFSYFPDCDYRRYGTPYKIFNYVEHQLPFVANQNDGSGRIAMELGIGYAIPHSVDDLTHWLTHLPAEREYQRLREHIAQVGREHSWQKRAMTVRDILLGRVESGS
ncbi:MAG TPA: hypothetical protein PKH19_04645, partial [Candidatus Syntrophosphaera sp.]|nr:hypothetical protein [Candidatus Syntrophosphaera sp.]